MKNKFLQFLGLTKRAGKILQGYNKCEEAVKTRKLRLIILSNDASENTKDKFSSYSEKYNVKMLSGYSKEELGNSLGLEEIKILGVTDANMSEKLINLWQEIEKK